MGSIIPNFITPELTETECDSDEEKSIQCECTCRQHRCKRKHEKYTKHHSDELYEVISELLMQRRKRKKYNYTISRYEGL